MADNPFGPVQKVVLAKVASLHPWSRNPRTITPARLADLQRDLEADPGMLWARPLVAREDGTVLMGNQRLAAAVALGWQTIPVAYVEVSDEVATLRALRDNVGYGEWEALELGSILRELEPGKIELTGFDSKALTQALKAGAYPALSIDSPDLEIPPPPAAPRTKPGDVLELGRHRLVCGDAHDPEALAALFGDRQAADMAFTDPPYAIYGSASGISSSVTDDRLVVPSFRAILNVLASRLPEFSPAYICCDWRSWAAWWEAARQTRMSPKNALVWDKGGYGMGSNWFNCYELVGYYLHLPPEKTMVSGRRRGIQDVQAPNVLHYPRPAGNDRHHNAAKPVPLIRHVLETTATAMGGEVVLDLFAGSGSTMFAAEQAGLTALMVEIDPAWCDVIRDRWEAFTNDQA